MYLSLLGNLSLQSVIPNESSLSFGTVKLDAMKQEDVLRGTSQCKYVQFCIDSYIFIVAASRSDKYGKIYYIGYWNAAETANDMHLIFDLDKFEGIDFRHPNWFYGEANKAYYGVCTYPASGTFTSVQQIGTIVR